MFKKIHTVDCPFDLADWPARKISWLFAGKDCVMALTNDGDVLQKTLDPALSIRPEYWTRITDIAISQYWPALAVGLVSDGTCMVAKRALRRCCEIRGISFDAVNEQIKALKDIVAVRVSDAIFALDKFGRVHHIPLDREDRYQEVDGWEKIRYLSVGKQASVFGIDEAGHVRCAGANVSQGPHGDLRPRLAAQEGVVDVASMGSEGELLLLMKEDGSVEDLNGGACEIPGAEALGFCGNFLLTTVLGASGQLYSCRYLGSREWERTCRRVRSAAVGLDDQYMPFLVYLK
jgi:hypothetical protein